MKHTRHSRSRWCGATHSFIHTNGNEVNLICTRFRDHLTKGKDPLKHFDELRRQHWYEPDSSQSSEPNMPLTPPAQPR